MCVGCNVAGGKQAPDCRPVASRGPPEERHRDDDEDEDEDDEDEDVEEEEDVGGVAGNNYGYQR